MGFSSRYTSLPRFFVLTISVLSLIHFTGDFVLGNRSVNFLIVLMMSEVCSIGCGFAWRDTSWPRVCGSMLNSLHYLGTWITFS